MNGKHVLGVLAGNDYDPALLRAWAESADVVIAADAGANTLYALGIVADIAVGDFDSIANPARETARQLIHDRNQDTTDCDKLLNLAARCGADEITLIGVEGDQLDHVMATFQSACKASIRVRLALRRSMAWPVKTGEGGRRFPVSGRFSVIPIVPCSGVSIADVAWPLKDADLSPMGLNSISNRTIEGKEPFVSVEQGVCIVFGECKMPFWDN